MKLSAKAAAGATAVALLLIPSIASAQEDGLQEYEPGANYDISGEAGYDNTLPSLQGDVYIDPGAPIEGDAWYFGHGGEYGPGDPARNVDSSPDSGRAIGKSACGAFAANFAGDPAQYRECVSAAAMAIEAPTTPREACRTTTLSMTPDVGETRRDFGACVAAGRGAKLYA